MIHVWEQKEAKRPGLVDTVAWLAFELRGKLGECKHENKTECHIAADGRGDRSDKSQVQR